MPIKNEAMLITYSDSMGKNIKETYMKLVKQEELNILMKS